MRTAAARADALQELLSAYRAGRTTDAALLTQIVEELCTLMLEFGDPFLGGDPTQQISVGGTD